VTGVAAFVVGVAGAVVCVVGVAGAVPPFVEAFVEIGCGFSPVFWPLGARGLGVMAGTAGGVIGTATAGFVGTEVTVEGGAEDEGVVGCVESTSDGGLVVGGVANSEIDGAAEGSGTCCGVGGRG
jgi:hypothetical protein